LKPHPNRVLRDNRSFRAYYNELTDKDIVIGLLNIKPTEEYLFTDLAARNIQVFPSVLAQQLSRSKCLQAAVLNEWMVPATFVARDRHDMIRNIQEYGRLGINGVVTKQNRFNCGLGIHLWNSIEEAYNQACFGNLQYPFVVQPLLEDVTDVRVIWFNDYVEAYWRKNPNTFRNNLYFGGECGTFHLNGFQKEMCVDIMNRGQFPYAHIDLMITPEGKTYLAEINLRGGLKGAKITTQEYQKLITTEEERFISRMEKTKKAPAL